MKVLVGSKNPTKINATKRAFSKYWKNVEVMARDIESSVSDMPTTDKECIQGAINRAKNAITKEVDFSVGAEGGALDTKYGMFVFAWAAILDKNGNIGLGNSGRFLIPEKLAST